MKISKSLNRFRTVLIVCLLSLTWNISAIHLCAEEAGSGPQSFASPKEAVDALKTAAEANDRAALLKIFGPEFKDILTGDKVQDANNTKRFAADLKEHCHLMKAGDDKLMLEVGPYDWPLPIPLVEEAGQWHFDTAAGKEEMINRHIGKDELHAIGVCRDFVTAERQYAELNPDSNPAKTYAQHFRSNPGKKDGLFWPTGSGEPASPFGPMVAEVRADGYADNPQSTGPHPFDGYYFRILTRQGDAAPGGTTDYLDHGNLTGGFALVAYPVQWGRSGIMTFIVNQDGKVFQCNLGEKTAEIAGAIKQYNPDSQWSLVKEEGVLRAASER